jgi:hypothetical protein
MNRSQANRLGLASAQKNKKVEVCTQTKSVCTRMYPSERSEIRYKVKKKDHKLVCTWYILVHTGICLKKYVPGTYFRHKVCTWYIPGTFLKKKVCTRYILRAKSMYPVYTATCTFMSVPYYSIVYTEYEPVCTRYILMFGIPDAATGTANLSCGCDWEQTSSFATSS